MCVCSLPCSVHGNMCGFCTTYIDGSPTVKPVCHLNNQDARMNFIITILMEKRGKEMKVQKG